MAAASLARCKLHTALGQRGPRPGNRALALTEHCCDPTHSTIRPLSDDPTRRYEPLCLWRRHTTRGVAHPVGPCVPERRRRPRLSSWPRVGARYTSWIVARRRYRGLVAVFLGALTSTASAGGWSSYAGGPDRLFFNPHPGAVTRRNVGNLQVKWRFHVGGPVTASPS